MDEQRSQAYLPLIQELLKCPSGEDNDVLNRNQELVHEGFVCLGMRVGGVTVALNS